MYKSVFEKVVHFPPDLLVHFHRIIQNDQNSYWRMNSLNHSIDIMIMEN